MKQLNMRKHNTNGRLITFCGLDGCGKSTMISMLSDLLQEDDTPVFLTKQPTDFVRQTQIWKTYMDQPDHDDYDYRSLSLLAASDRIQHSNRVIMKELSAGKTVISDRYFYSCLANLRARSYTNDMWIYEIAQSIPKPDLAFFLDVPVELAVKRVRTRPEERYRYIDIDLQYRLKGEYLKLAETNGGIIIPSDGSAAATFERVLSYIKDGGGSNG